MIKKLSCKYCNKRITTRDNDNVQSHDQEESNTCNTCNLFFSSLKLENGLKKHVRIFARIKYGFVELVVILFTFNTRCDDVPESLY